MGRNTAIPGGATKRLIRVGKGEDPCWEWIGGLTTQGYPRKRWMGQEISARRWMYLILFGPVKASHVLEAKCNNRLCVNPGHMKSVPLKLAQRAGDGTILLQSDVDEMRLRLAHPEAIKRFTRKLMIDAMCEEFGISYKAALFVLSNRSWHDPKLPVGIIKVVNYCRENPPPCASTSSLSSSSTAADTLSKSVPPTPISKPRSRRPRRAPAPQATRSSPSQLKSASQSNGER